MFEWCFRSRYGTGLFGIAVVISVASFSGRLGAGDLSIVFGLAAGMPVLVAGSPPLDGEGYLAATTSRDRAVDAVLTAAGALLAGAAAALPAAAVLGDPIPSLLGAVTGVLGGQVVFFLRNAEHLEAG